MVAELGLRERKKLRTRVLIADTASRLFAEQGFDRVAVAEVARAADVSVATVFNYFPTKEDLVYGRLEDFEQEMLDAIHDRPPDESIIDAFERFVLRPGGLLASEHQADAEFLAAITKMIAQSDRLLAREREIYDRYTQGLADLVAAETGGRAGDVEAWVIANALIGVHRALIRTTRRGALAGTPHRHIAKQVHTEGKRALARLRDGLHEMP